MRIATAQYQSNMNQSLQLNQERLSKLTQQMAEGKRLLLPSDDPIDSVRMSRLQREEAALTQYRDNIATVKIRLAKTETYLGSMVNDIAAGRDLIVFALDGSNSPDDLQALISPLESLRRSLLDTANTRDDEGNYIFSGTATSTKPIEETKPGYEYKGNDKKQQVVVGNGLTTEANTDMADIVGLLKAIDNTIDKLRSDKRNANDPGTGAVLLENLNSFDGALKDISGKIAVLGGNQNILDTLAANHANVSLSNQMAITDIGQLDMGVAATELNGYSTALQAAYKAYGRISNLSLFSAL